MTGAARLSCVLAAATAAVFGAAAAQAGAFPSCVSGPQLYSTECGIDSSTSATIATAVGAQAQANGSAATSLGVGSIAGAVEATALGASSRALGASSLAAGVNANAGVPNSTAIGANASAGGQRASAFGAGANAANFGSTAIGAGAVTTRDAQTVIGGQGTSVTIGDITASTVEQKGAVSIVTVDASGTLGRDTAVVSGLIGGQAALFDLASTINVQAQRGIAAAAAVTTAPLPSAPGRVSYAANGSVYRGQFAFGASAAYRFDTAKPFALTGGVGVAGKGDTVGRVGVAGEF